VRACLSDRTGPFQRRGRSYQYHAYGDQLMALNLNPNDCARTAQPSLWIFQGRSVGLLVVGVMFFVCLMLVLSRLGVDWTATIAISALPLSAITIFVQFYVNGRPPSYALDLLALHMWRLRCVWYLECLLDKPPQLWIVSRAPRHPKEFS
jgi:hypothetical protein